MNIFAVSRHPRSCARALDDKRLNKMILETAQVICTVLNQRAGEQVTPYRNSHEHNPITKWADDDDHLRWLYELGMAYGREILTRHGRKHACQLVLEGLTFKFDHIFDGTFETDHEFHNGARHRKLGLDFTHLPVHQAYREYLNARWPGDKRKPVWTNRKRPSWCEL